MSFGEYIKKLRKSIGLTQEDVATKAGVTKSYLSKIEKGHVSPPSEDKLLQLAEALQDDPNTIIYRAGKISSEIRDLILQEPGVFDYLHQKLKDKHNAERKE
ncbi:helix-turn-helix domain-containing protein [Paenibacillus jiagnxiensis]|uniref:helix-turn-helix domain-containing protein n=1 Tax=Paenibacillus jiagnxiensis TaxID=3228926 RepID=UPI0033BDFD57